MLKGRYEILKGYENNHVTIGFGSYGQVKLAKDVQNGEIVAIKIINKVAKKQVMYHNRLFYPKIIQLLDFHIDTVRQITYMILEYAQGGTLFEKLKTKKIPKDEVQKYMKDICEAVAYLHSKEIMHRDIKPENILLTKNNVAKLCDFGFAALLGGQRKTLCGTYEYMSPEMIQSKPYDYKIDIWALGILLFELIVGKAPFRGDTPDEVLNQMKTKIYFNQRFDNTEINLIRSILRVTPQKRPTIFEILENNYFKTDKNTINTNRTAETEQQKDPFKAKHPFNSSTTEYQKVNPLKMTFTKPPQNSYPFYVKKNAPKQYQHAMHIINRQKHNKQYPDHSPSNKTTTQHSTVSSNFYKITSPPSTLSKDLSFNQGSKKGRFS